MEQKLHVVHEYKCMNFIALKPLFILEQVLSHRVKKTEQLSDSVVARVSLRF